MEVVVIRQQSPRLVGNKHKAAAMMISETLGVSDVDLSERGRDLCFDRRNDQGHLHALETIYCW
jgi:hypothetical protein